MTPLEKEESIRKILEEEFHTPLFKTRLAIGTKFNGEVKYHEFDGVSADQKIVVEIKTNELKVTPEKPNGRYFSAIKWALLGDIYMLSRVNASSKYLVLTDQSLFNICLTDLDGILPENTQIIFRRIGAK